MQWFKDTLKISTHGKGMYSITPAVLGRVQAWNIREGLCTLYLQHTSASLVIGENYDPSAQADMETFMERLVPENQSWITHTLEGPDDSPSHIRAMITPTSQTIPIDEGKLSLGMWQGIYLFEHRAHPQTRLLLVRCLSVDD